MCVQIGSQTNDVIKYNGVYILVPRPRARWQVMTYFMPIIYTVSVCTLFFIDLEKDGPLKCIDAKSNINCKYINRYKVQIGYNDSSI